MIRTFEMHDRLFEAALGITAPWSVTGVQFDEAAKVLTVAIDFAVGSRFAVEGVPGEYPVHEEAVAMMDRIVARTEADPLYRQLIEASHTQPQKNTADAIGWAARSAQLPGCSTWLPWWPTRTRAPRAGVGRQCRAMP
jgi:hypothetical protein